MISGIYQLAVPVKDRFIELPPLGNTIDLPAGMVGEINNYQMAENEIEAVVWFSGLTAPVYVFADELIRIA